MPGNDSLAKKIRMAHSQAISFRDHACQIYPPLKRGLGIYIKVSQLREHVLLTRGTDYPSDTEWQVVLDRWPHTEIPKDIQPRRHREGRMYCLSADWPRPAPKVRPAALQAEQEGADA